MLEYKHFIPQNTALDGAKKIGVYDSDGNRIVGVVLGNLAKAKGQKQYSFGALSDVHITYDTATTDFQKALTYLNNDVDVAFTCICGDLTENGSASQLAQYKAIVDSYSADTPVYAIAGNHENHSNYGHLQTYTGQPLYYSFTQGDDVFIMLGCYAWYEGDTRLDGEVFTVAELQWLYETLEVNRNKRCFVFQHVFPWGDSGNANNLYTYNMFTGTKCEVFIDLMQHYKNVVFFHGHSHMRFDLQEIDEKANYSEALGYRSVHIPSLSVPRDVDSSGTNYEAIYAESEGYVVDVYKKGIHLKGRDFVDEVFLPIASYWIDTTLVEIEANTFTDNTGTITT